MNTTSALEIDKKTKIGVLYGGLSSEREVSLRSGANCHAALQRLGYENAELIDVDTNVSQVLLEKQIKVVMLCLHGCPGEDGTLQGLLELLRIPYTGSGVLASALAISKPMTKQILKSFDLPYPHTVNVYPENIAGGRVVGKTLPSVPAMVKPLAEGSSVGVSKITNEADLVSCVVETVKKYKGALVETYIDGPEITIGVLEEVEGDRRSTIALPILELRPKSKAGFYDYEAKYTKGMTEFILPAELNPATTKLAQELAVRTFKALGCSGYARVDMMVSRDGQPYVLEVNTLPGMTDTSDLPAMAEEAGISYDLLVEKILFSAGLDK
ncbi:MAG TPA: D-alanine--D-alanine ligase [Planktothrix sp.]